MFYEQPARLLASAGTLFSNIFKVFGAAAKDTIEISWSVEQQLRL
jgi:hypothetical protein